MLRSCAYLLGAIEGGFPEGCDELIHGRAVFRRPLLTTSETIHANSVQACSALPARGQAGAGHVQEFHARLAGPLQSPACRQGGCLR